MNLIQITDNTWDRFVAVFENKLQRLTPEYEADREEVRQACYADSDVSGESLYEALEAKRKAKRVVHFDFSYDSSTKKFTFKRMPSFERVLGRISSDGLKSRLV